MVDSKNGKSVLEFPDDQGSFLELVSRARFFPGYGSDVEDSSEPEPESDENPDS